MTTASFGSDVIPQLPRRARRSTALRSLMQDWEQEVPADEGESETELMVLLSGMVSLSVAMLGDA
jgi:hypothetical protein